MAKPQQNPPATLKPSAQKRRSSIAAFQHHDYRALWIGQFISMVGSQMQLVAINWHVWLLTKSSFALGIVGIVRVVPIILCSLAGGVIADASDRKRLIIATQIVMLACAAILSIVTFNGLIHVWPIYLLTAIASAAVAFENPARQALMPSLVPVEDFPNAVSLGMISLHVATICGPLVAGFILASRGPGIVYLINAGSFIAVIAAMLVIRTSGRIARQDDRPANRVSFSALSEGLKFVWRTPIIVQTMTIDFVATFFASATALLPIFADQVLHVGAHGFGVLSSGQAMGSVLAALVMARIGNVNRQGMTVILAVVGYGVATVVFGLSRNFGLSMFMLAMVGASDTVSTVLRQTIRQLATPDNLRGRMTSVNMMFFMGGPQLGEFEAGTLARFVGAPLSVVIGGIGCLAGVAIIVLKFPLLRSYQGAHTESRG